jgi:hypothetical protein
MPARLARKVVCFPKFLLLSSLLTAGAFWAGPLFGAATIDFDRDANNNVLTAPDAFMATVRLTELYAPFGVHFVGPGGLDGGAILNVDSNFGVSAHSGTNFLAFNRDATLSDGGKPTDPETILFDSPMQSVSIFAAGGFDTKHFTLQAFSFGGLLLDSQSIDTKSFNLLAVNSVAGIRKVVLTSSGGSVGFVYDDLSFTPVPEPSVVYLFGAMLAAGLVFRQRQVACRR